MKKLNKIFILGSSGSGKTFLANLLSKRLNIYPYDLDDIFWYKNYNKKRAIEKRKVYVHKICKNKKWIIEGVYVKWTQEAIKKADLIIWLDFPFHIQAFRLINRFIKRKLSNPKDHSFMSLIHLLRFAKSYKTSNRSAGFNAHKFVLDKHKAKVVYINNKVKLDKFLKKLL